MGRQTAYFVAASGGRLQSWPIDSGIVASNAPIDGPTIGALGEHIAVSRDGRYVAIPSGSTVAVYVWQNDHIGALLSSQTLPGAVRGVAWAPDGSALAIAHTNSPFVSVYRFTSSGFQTKFSDPATLPTGNARAVAFHPSGAALIVAHTTSPFASAYPWDPTIGFGAKYANPATLPGGNCIDVRFRGRLGSHVVVLWNGNPGFAIYPFTIAGGFGLKLADPAIGAAQTGEGCDWSVDGQLLGIGGGAGAGALFYSLVTGVIGDVTVVSGDAKSVRFSPDGRYVGFYLVGSPYLSVARYASMATYMVPLDSLPGVGALAGPIAWGATGGVSVPVGVHPITSPAVAYAPATPGDWDVAAPVQVAEALDLLAMRTAQLQALVDYIVAQTGIVPPDQAAMPYSADFSLLPMQPLTEPSTMQPTPQ